MNLSTNILGTTTVSYIRNKQTVPVLRIGSDTFVRADLAKSGCFTFLAAANLSAILHRALKVKDTRDLFERITPAHLALPRLGAVSLAVLGAAFEIKGLGGAAPLEGWVRKHQPEGAFTTFTAMKHRDAQERAAEKKAARRRKAARRDQAHRMRVDRFVEKQGVSV